MINPLDLSGKRILITGASSGIGRETCVLLSELGARVVLVARRKKLLEETLSMMQGDGHFVRPYDLTQIDSIPIWLRETALEMGTLHGLVHSAGIQRPLAIRSVDRAALDETMTINFAAGYSLARGFRHSTVHAESSSVVFLSSVAGLIGISGNSTYSASKGALIALTKTLALELKRDNIRVNCVAPGLVETQLVEHAVKNYTGEQYEAIKAMHPLGIGQPRDVAYAIAFLLADTGRWITGTTLVVDGGYTAQ